MRQSKRRALGKWLGLALALLGLGIWLAREVQARGPLYCFERPGTVWNGVAPLPAGFQRECPQSRSYRAEVRSGQSRVEQYRVPGWQPRVLIPALKQGGYLQITDEPIGPGNYSAFLGRAGVPEVQYLASLQGDTTLITLSGRP
ncbi:hypothetical protein [Deinococcus humi]|uniref:Uncharacterized protein n=1 Tax=Deinococcus humi TaxID=662880 RepID=A0A7W8JWD9_9DEIO|nr:hypothetical protein [Deinococcus humi]MBB5364477.1 hypothetical protein [Deinococcus humi]GGO32975.1 hypothetical protein GCM10008949_31450 [Deinococcus humi]